MRSPSAKKSARISIRENRTVAITGLITYAIGRVVRKRLMIFTLLTSIFLKKYVSAITSTEAAPIRVIKRKINHIQGFDPSIKLRAPVASAMITKPIDIISFSP